MDIKRPPKSKIKKRIKTAILIVIGLVAVGGITYGLAKLKPAAPTIDRATAVIETVKRGEMVRDVRGNGTLVPEVTRWVPAPAQGRVEKINLQAGVEVDPSTVLVELSNPQMEQVAVDADFQVKAAVADEENLRVRLESDTMTQKAAIATINSQYSQAKIQLDADELLAKQGLIPEISVRISRVAVQDLANRLKVEQERLAVSAKSTRAQLNAASSRLQQLRAMAQLRRQEVDVEVVALPHESVAGEHAGPHRAAGAQVPHECAGIDPREPDDVLPREFVLQRSARPPARDTSRRVSHHEPGHPDLRICGVTGGPDGLVVLVVPAGVADLRRGGHDDLPVVAGVGECFLVSGHARAEHGLAEGLSDRTERRATENPSVFEDQHRGAGSECSAAHALSPFFSTAPEPAVRAEISRVVFVFVMFVVAVIVIVVVIVTFRSRPESVPESIVDRSTCRPHGSPCRPRSPTAAATGSRARRPSS